jgi:pteridine reductase
VQKNILITGAAKRIGAACARLLHQEGCNILLHYHRSQAAAEKLATELNTVRENTVHLVQANLLDELELQVLIDQAKNCWGGVDVLLNNAAQFYPGLVGSVSSADWDNLLNSNLKAPFFLSQALAPVLAARQGCIINIGDIYAEKGLLAYPVYSISKAGLQAMTKCLAKELAPNIRVNAVAPGAILWPENGLSDSEQQQILQRIALQRPGRVEDIAKAVRFLIADADYITGHTLTIDGGRSLFV